MLAKVDLSNLMILKITTINKIRNKLRKDTESLPGEQIPQGFLELHKLKNIYFDKTKTNFDLIRPFSMYEIQFWIKS